MNKRIRLKKFYRVSYIFKPKDKTTKYKYKVIFTRSYSYEDKELHNFLIGTYKEYPEFFKNKPRLKYSRSPMYYKCIAPILDKNIRLKYVGLKYKHTDGILQECNNIMGDLSSEFDGMYKHVIQTVVIKVNMPFIRKRLNKLRKFR